MPVVPTIKQPSVRVRPLNLPTQNIGGVTPEAFGAGIARAKQDAGRSTQRAGQSAQAFGNSTQRVGQSTQAVGASLQETGRSIQAFADNLGRLAIKKQNQDNELELKGLALDYSASASKFKNAFLESKGKDTIDSFDEISKKIVQVGDDFRGRSLKNPVVSRGIDLFIKQDQLQTQSQIVSHFEKQKRVVFDDRDKSLIDKETDNGIKNFMDFGSIPNFETLEQLAQKQVSLENKGLVEEAVSLGNEAIGDIMSGTNKVLESAAKVRGYAEDRADRNGEDTKVAADKAESNYYVSVVKAAEAAGEINQALKIFFSVKEKILGEDGVKITRLLKDRVEKRTALSAGRLALESVQHLPIEEQLPASLAKLQELLGDTPTLILAENRAEALFNRKQADRKIVSLHSAGKVVQNMLNNRRSIEQVTSDVTENLDLTPEQKEAQLNVLASLKAAREDEVKSLSEDFVRRVFSVTDGNVVETRKFIERVFSGEESSGPDTILNIDNPGTTSGLKEGVNNLSGIGEMGNSDKLKGKRIATLLLEALAKSDAEVQKSSVPHIVDKAVRDIISKAGQNVPVLDKKGSNVLADAIASNEARRASALADARDEFVGKPIILAAVLKDINGHYDSIKAASQEVEKEFNSQKSIDLASLAKESSASLAEQLEFVANSDFNSNIRKGAIQNIKDNNSAKLADKARKEAEDKKILQEFRADISKAVLAGVTLDEFKKSNPKVYESVSGDLEFMNRLRSAAIKVSGDEQFNTVSSRAKLVEVANLTQDQLVKTNLGHYSLYLSKEDFSSLAALKRGAIASRESKNAKLKEDIAGLIKRYQPKADNDRPKLTSEDLSLVESVVWTRVNDLQNQNQGKDPDEKTVRKIVSSALSSASFKPDKETFIEGLFNMRRGGGARDVTGKLVSDMSRTELESLHIEKEKFRPELNGSLNVLVDLWKETHPKAGEPSEDVLELLRGRVELNFLGIEVGK